MLLIMILILYIKLLSEDEQLLTCSGISVFEKITFVPMIMFVFSYYLEIRIYICR